LDEIELRNILFTVQTDLPSPIAIRYPRRRGVHANWKNDFQQIPYSKATRLKEGKNIAILSTGFIGQNVIMALNLIEDSISDNFAHYHFGFVKPLNEACLHNVFRAYKQIITIEEGTIKGGFGSAILEFASENKYQTPVDILGIKDEFISHGTIDELLHDCGLSVDALVEYLQKKIPHISEESLN